MISDLCVVGQAWPRRLHLLCPLSRMHKAPFTLLRQAYRSRQGAGAGKDSGGLVEGRGPGGPLSALPSSLLASPGGQARLAPGSGPLCPRPHHCLTNTPQLLAHEACRGLWTCPHFPSRPPGSPLCCTHAGAGGCSEKGLGTGGRQLRSQTRSRRPGRVSCPPYATVTTLKHLQKIVKTNTGGGGLA